MQRSRLYFLLFMCCFLQYQPAQSQSLAYRNFTVEDGLSNSIVYRIFQDSKGYLWFSTDHGLSKFNGINFTNYTTADGLTSNYILSISESPDSTLWICTYGGGICKFKDEVFEPYMISGNDYPKYPLYIWYDKKKRIWLINTDWKLGYIQGNNYTDFNISKHLGNNKSFLTHTLFVKDDTSQIGRAHV